MTPKKLFIVIGKVADLLLSPFVIVVAIWLKFIRTLGVHRFSVSNFILRKIRVFPVRDHYYEPLIFPENLIDFSLKRDLGFELNVSKQLSLIREFSYQSELENIPVEASKGKIDFFLNNGHFGPGDADFFYSLIRHLKPGKIIEIGSGYSSLLAKLALDKNNMETPDIGVKHFCIEPYEMPWLESKVSNVVRKKVEDVPLDFFKQLEPNDILFIDSSHVIRPEGDVLFEFLGILPRIKSGTYIHVHDIFTPYHYPDEWTFKEKRLWNEQYLLEALLIGNSQFEIVAGLYGLYRDEYAVLSSCFPNLGLLPKDKAPSSFWLKKL